MYPLAWHSLDSGSPLYVLLMHECEGESLGQDVVYTCMGVKGRTLVKM